MQKSAKGHMSLGQKVLALISLKKAGILFLVFGVVLVPLLSIVLPNIVFAAPLVVIDTINGQAPTGHCIAGTLTITGHGTRGTNGGPYSLDIAWGDGVTTTVSVGSGANGNFNFGPISHTPVGASTGLTLNLYHGSPSGNDSHITVVNQCVVPPTKGVLTIAKHVVNDNGGTATASSFTLHIKQGTSDVTGSPTSGSETGTDFQLLPATYTVSEDAHSGYAQTSIVCLNTTDSVSIVGNSVNLLAGKNYLCTITNTFVTLSNQTINVTTHAPASASYGSTFPVAATATSGLPVAITTTGGCSIPASTTNSGTVTTTSGTVACVVHYNQSGNGTYNPAPEVTDSTTATPKNITVTADSGKTKIYGGADPVFTYTYDALVGTDSLSGALSRVSGENIGTYPINQGTLTSGSNYTINFVSANLTITQKDLTITANNQTKTFGTSFTFTGNEFSQTGLIGQIQFQASHLLAMARLILQPLEHTQ